MAGVPPGGGVNRRQLFGAAAAVGVGGLVGVASQRSAPDGRPIRVSSDVRAARESFHGPHQAGIATPAQAYAVFVGFDLVEHADAAALVRLLKLWTDDAARLTAGEAALADTEPELATTPARLTVTVGFGPGLFEAVGLSHRVPRGFGPLPRFGIDRLEDRWTGGDLLLQVCADDPTTVSHALRMLTKDARAFASVRWTQHGFRHAAGSPGIGTARNLMGQLDGTVNPRTGPEFDEQVWVADGSWLDGGTTMVLRRIRMTLDSWDVLDRGAKELVVGRRLRTGAPLSGQREHEEPNLTATDDTGLLVIPDSAHVRRARTGGERFLRRGYSYDSGPAADGTPDSGLLFAAYQADISRQFLPVQRRLAELDALNEWTVPIGSAVFAIPPGCQRGGWLGETLLA